MASGGASLDGLIVSSLTLGSVPARSRLGAGAEYD